MSAIAGVFPAEGRGAEAAVADMLSAMARRAPDGRVARSLGPVALGHGLLATVAANEVGLQPLVDDALAITADLRLDNREALIEALSLPDGLSDAALVLAAYRRWGEACPEHLVGDFAFALWDAGREMLFCVRDHAGVKPFHYHQGEGGFAFATEMRGVLAAPGVPAEVDELRIADFLAGMSPDPQSALRGAVLRLPPAHRLTVSRSGSELSCYWRLDPAPAPPTGDPIEGFKAVFREAVRCRMRGPRPVAAMLSGGLDSSSIACVASDIRKHEGGPPVITLSMVFDKTPEWSERPYIEAALACGDFDPVFLATDDHAPFGDFAAILDEQEGPYLAPSLAMSRRLHQEARKRGIGVVLDGHGGDEVVSFGYGRLVELALAGRWPTLWREVDGLAATYGTSRGQAFLNYFNMFGPGRKVIALRRRIARRLARGRPNPAPTPAPRPHWLKMIEPGFAARTDIEARYRAQAATGAERAKTEREHHWAVLTSDLNVYAFEVLDRLTAGQGVEGRYPFWDKRLVEYCLALPSDAKLRDGWARYVLRKAMDGVLPAQIQWRRTKLDFGPHIILGMLNHHRELLDQLILEDSEGLGRYVDLASAAEAYGRIVKQAEAADGYEVQGVWRTVVLALWLRELRRGDQA